MEYLLKGIGLGLFAAVTPSPYQAFLLQQTLKTHWRHAIPLVLAPFISDGPIIIIVLFALSRLPSTFLQIIQIVGGVFILYLAYGAFLAFKTSLAAQEPKVKKSPLRRKAILQAAFINILSPNPYIFWSTVLGPILLTGWRESPGKGLSFLVGFYGMLIVGMGALVIIFDTAKKVFPKLTHLLLGGLTVLLFLFGLYQIWSGVSGILAH
ncbi:MAG TPA: LysE family transporter [Bdellovibrionota bacterium]|nr:LysE family transporter [Bdellovibrionota bacterium]